MLQSRRDGVPTGRQSPDHHPIPRVQFVDDAKSDVTQSAGDPMPDDRVTDGLRHDETDLRSIAVDGPEGMHDEVGLDGTYSPLDRQPEIRRPCHPVPGRKHRVKSCVESRSQGTAALVAPAGHDGPTGTGAHAQPKTVHACTPSVVRLKGPLALGHGCLSSVTVASASFTVTTSSCRLGHRRRSYERRSRLLAPARYPEHPGRSRVATFGRLFEGTDEISLGQTTRAHRRIRHTRHNIHRPPAGVHEAVMNVAERLAPAAKTVSFWQCRFRAERPSTTD
jgi:hypothetical protein